MRILVVSELDMSKKTLGGGAGPAQVIGSQANSGRTTDGGTFTVTPR